MLTFAQLTPAEREDLKLCGITAEQQLARTSAETVWDDLQKAISFFPNHRIALSPERLLELWQTAAATAQEEAARTGATSAEKEAWAGLNISTTHEVTTGFKRRSSHRNGAAAPAAEVPSITEKRKEQEIRAKEISKASHDIHCSCSGATYLAAIATLLVVPSIMAMIAAPLLFLNGIPDKKILFCCVAVILLGLPYLVLSRMALCSVCHMPVFSFAKYGRNRAAHHLPLLGYTIATALHVLFTMRFRCPACGTGMRLFRRHTSRAHFH